MQTGILQVRPKIRVSPIRDPILGAPLFRIAMYRGSTWWTPHFWKLPSCMLGVGGRVKGLGRRVGLGA